MPTDHEGSAPPVFPTRFPPLRGSLGPYDGPTSHEGLHLEAQLMATARCTIHPMYRRSPGDCLMLLRRALALNVPIGIAIDHVYINTGTGKGGLSAQLMAGLLARAGIDKRMLSETDRVVEFLFLRGRKKIGTAKWTIAEAVDWGLTRREHWQKSPTDCLWARALARGCRRHFSGIVMGMGYTPEEVYDMRADVDLVEASEPTDPQVQEILDQAASESATADLIKTDIIPRARKAKLLTRELPDGRTLQQALAEAWRTTADQEAAARADGALVDLAGNAEHADAPPPAVMSAPAGEGALPCGCCAATVLAAGEHDQAVCTGQLAVVG